VIKPICIVDQHHKRLLLSEVGQSVEHREAHQEHTGRRPRLDAERHAQRESLRLRKLAQLVFREPGPQRVQRAVRELRFRLDPRQADNCHALSPGDDLIQQSCLPDPRFATQHERTTAPRPNVEQQLIDNRLLALTAQQNGPTRARHQLSRIARHRLCRLDAAVSARCLAPVLPDQVGGLQLTIVKLSFFGSELAWLALVAMSVTV
jgi:hypothetical protein